MNFNLENNNSETLIAKVMKHFDFKHQYQVAEYFGVTAQTLSGWVKSGTVPDKYIMRFQLDVQEIQKENNVKEPVDYTNKREFQNSKSETASSEFSFTIFFKFLSDAESFSNTNNSLFSSTGTVELFSLISIIC